MVEKNASLYDIDSVTTPLIPTDTSKGESAPIDTKRVEFDGAPKDESDCQDREIIQVAGVSSAIVGLLLGGPILAVIAGFGASYVAETNENVRNNVSKVWTDVKRFDKKHNVVKHGVHGIGKGTVWVFEKIANVFKGNRNNKETVDSWVASQPTVAKT